MYVLRKNESGFYSRYLLAVLGFGIFLLFWGILSFLVKTRSSELAIFLPSPFQVLKTGTEMLSSSDFWYAVLITNLRVIGGFLLGALLAIPVGVMLGTIPKLDRLASPISNFGRYIPIPAIVPLLIVWAGVGDLQKILLLSIGTFFQVLVLVTDAVRRVPSLHIDSALTLGAGWRKIISKVIFPASLPQIYDACRVGIGLTWSYLLVAEIVASENGLGYFIIRSQRFLQTDRIFFTIIVLGILGLIYDQAFTRSRQWFFPWAQEERSV